jgi:CheY-like chemotaxis protein
LIAAILESSGAAVSMAPSVHEGLALLRANRPDVLVSDIGMAGASGYDLIKGLRSLAAAEGGETPAIALTAYARAEDRAKALGLGFDQHVSKPVAPEELVLAIESLSARPRGS